MKPVLIVTNQLDYHGDKMVEVLESLGGTVIRLNTELLLQKWQYEWISTNTVEHIAFSSQHHGFTTGEIGAVWFRRPEEPIVSQKMPSNQQIFAVSETGYFLYNLYADLKAKNILIVGDPFVLRTAKLKLHQLSVAKSVGFKIPATLCTNIPQTAQEFFNKHSQRIIVKGVYGTTFEKQKQIASWTQRIGASDVSKLDRVGDFPCILQEEILRGYDLRVTVIGNDVFAVKMHRSPHNPHVDWRLDDEKAIQYEVWKAPKRFIDLCLEFTRRSKLLFSAMDFIVNPAGDPIFLENNPNGQYYWIEEKTGLPLTETLAKLLLNHASS